jgi:hypothetical protein
MLRMGIGMEMIAGCATRNGENENGNGNDRTGM